MEKKSIRLGLMAPLTGLVEIYGQEISWAATIACEEINESGGLLGCPLELIIVDDGSLPETAVPAANSLVDHHHCTAIIGNLLSNSRIAVASLVAEPKKIPYLNFSFYEGSINSKYFFHFAALPNQQIDKMIPYMAKNFGHKMFFAGSNYEWPIGSIDAAKKALKACGGEIVGEEYLPIGSSQVDELLELVARSGADVFVPYFAGSDQINLLTRFTELGLKERMKVVMGHYDEAMVKGLPPSVREGFYSSNTYFMSIDNPKNKAYLSALAKREDVTGIWPDGNGILTNFGEGTYLCVHAFAKAVRKAGSIERDEIIKALENIVVEGPQGPVFMDQKSHHAQVNNYLSRCNKGGIFSIIESFDGIKPVIPERYREVSEDQDIADHQVGIIDLDSGLRIVRANKALLKMLSYSDDIELVGQSVKKLWALEREFESIEKNLKNKGFWDGRVSIKTKAGSIKLVEFSISQYQLEVNHLLYRVSVSELLLPIKKESRDILSAADVAIIATDKNGNIVRSNNCASELFGYTPAELLKMSVHHLLPPQYRSKHRHYFQQFVESHSEDILMGMRGEISAYKKDGSLFPAKASISKFYENEQLVIVATLHDITEQKKAEEDLIWKSTHDSLTHLPNRELMQDRLTNALNRAQRSQQMIALLFIDIDNFKLINDSYGHDMGDLFLIEVANRLISTVRPGDTVARFGGDEFIVLCEQSGTESDICNFAQRINDKIKEPITIDELVLLTSASIGIAFSKAGKDSCEEMLRNADTALYKAKERGRDGWHIYNHEIHEQAKRKLEISNKLNAAIINNEFKVRYQPIIDTKTKKIIGVEILIRWYSEGKFIPPDVFIPIAEMSGAILPLGMWVFEKACKSEKLWRDYFGDKKTPYISVNVSTKQLNYYNLVDDFAKIIKRTSAEPSNILLEITETSLMENVETNIKVLQALSELELGVAIDDFGTGYSSLSQILRMPICKLKIDRIFIDGINHRKDSRSIVSAVTSMAHALDLSVIAEGVENIKEYQVIRELSCDAIQGYYFSKPLSESELLDFLKKNIEH